MKLRADVEAPEARHDLQLFEDGFNIIGRVERPRLRMPAIFFLLRVLRLLLLQVCRVLQQNLDRKSTRLNSSHPSISYAVLCLKKKTETTLPNVSRPVRH